MSILVDDLTNSIRNTISGDSFSTVVAKLLVTDLPVVRKKQGWKFNWATELRQTDRQVYKLTITGNPTVIQGAMSISDRQDHYYLHLIESAPFNLGQRKLYEGVPGNLFAFACKASWDQGNNGLVSFQAKTNLITHYEKTLGAAHVGGHNMIIYPHAALQLILRYFPPS